MIEWRFQLSLIVSSVSGLRINNSWTSVHRNQIRISPETTSPPLSAHSHGFRVGLGSRCTYEINARCTRSMNIESWYTWKTTKFQVTDVYCSNYFKQSITSWVCHTTDISRSPRNHGVDRSLLGNSSVSTERLGVWNRIFGERVYFQPAQHL